MVIRLYSPFNKSLGLDVFRLELSEKTSLKTIIQKLVLQYPRFKDFVPDDLTDEKLSKNFVVLKKGYLLHLNDKIGEDDELKILFPLAGG